MLSPIICFFDSGTAKAPAVNTLKLLRLNTLRDTKTTFLTPERFNHIFIVHSSIIFCSGKCVGSTSCFLFQDLLFFIMYIFFLPSWINTLVSCP